MIFPISPLSEFFLLTLHLSHISLSSPSLSRLNITHLSLQPLSLQPLSLLSEFSTLSHTHTSPLLSISSLSIYISLLSDSSILSLTSTTSYNTISLLTLSYLPSLLSTLLLYPHLRGLFSHTSTFSYHNSAISILSHI